MFRTNAVAATLTAVLLVLAGCTGGAPGGLGGGDTGDAAASEAAGTVTLYVSDQPGAMGDFEHLNVTVDRVAYHRVTAGNDTAAAANGTETNGTDAESDTDPSADERDGDSPEGEDGWHTYDINDTTVDLTELQGENATVVGQQRLPNGTYDRVFLHVSDVNGTLKDGDGTRVKLPSGKLQIETRFTVGANESLDFVFDATVVKAGKSGKYVLQPVVSESGTDVPIKEVERDEASGVAARFTGEVQRGEATTVEVTQRGQPVAGATVEIDDQTYRTGGDGTVTFDVPADADEVEVEIAYADGEIELKRTFPEEEDASESESENESESEREDEDETENSERQATEGDAEADERDDEARSDASESDEGGGNDDASPDSEERDGADTASETG